MLYVSLRLVAGTGNRFRKQKGSTQFTYVLCTQGRKRSLRRGSECACGQRPSPACGTLCEAERLNKRFSIVPLFAVSLSSPQPHAGCAAPPLPTLRKSCLSPSSSREPDDGMNFHTNTKTSSQCDILYTAAYSICHRHLRCVLGWS